MWVLPEMCVCSRALTSYPFCISSSRHSTCPPSAAECTGLWPESRIALFVVMGMRVLRALEGERQRGEEEDRKRARDRSSEKQMAENRTYRKMFIRLWFELQCWNWQTAIHRGLFVEGATVKTLQSSELQRETCFSRQFDQISHKMRGKEC